MLGVVHVRLVDTRKGVDDNDVPAGASAHGHLALDALVEGLDALEWAPVLSGADDLGDEDDGVRAGLLDAVDEDAEADGCKVEKLGVVGVVLYVICPRVDEDDVGALGVGEGGEAADDGNVGAPPAVVVVVVHAAVPKTANHGDLIAVGEEPVAEVAAVAGEVVAAETEGDGVAKG